MLLWLLLVLLVLSRWYLYRDQVRRLGQPVARQRLYSSTLIMITVYLGCLALLLGFENKLIYHPTPATQYWMPPQGLSPLDLQLHSDHGEAIHAWWCPDVKAHFTILFSHGNAGNLSNHAWIIPEMRSRFRCNVLIYDYPGFGKSTGSPSESGCYAAANAAYTWLRDVQHIPPDRIILMGQSLGCAMACELATKVEHRGLVLLSPFLSIRAIGQELFPIFPVTWLMHHRYDNKSKLQNYQKPLLIGHSTADEVIPYHHGQDLFAASASKEKTFFKILNESHNALPLPYFEAMNRFLDQCEKGATPR